jgi:hypothetical protein
MASVCPWKAARIALVLPPLLWVCADHERPLGRGHGGVEGLNVASDHDRVAVTYERFELGRALHVILLLQMPDLVGTLRQLDAADQDSRASYLRIEERELEAAGLN